MKYYSFYPRPKWKCFLPSPKLCQCKLTSILSVTSCPAFLSPRCWWWPGSLRMFLCWSLNSLNSSIKLVKCGMISLGNVVTINNDWFSGKYSSLSSRLIILSQFRVKHSTMLTVQDCFWLQVWWGNFSSFQLKLWPTYWPILLGTEQNRPGQIQ